MKQTNPDTARCTFADLWRLIERFADGRVGEAELRRVWNGSGGREDGDEQIGPFRPRAWVEKWVYRDDDRGYSIRDATIADLLREIFGNPFRPVETEPSWLTSDVLALARGIYDERAFDRMPILADALQDAGCANEDVLNHCRDTKQRHVRGCWVVDLLTDRG